MSKADVAATMEALAGSSQRIGQLVADVVQAIARAESDARALHDAGRCGESEWSCSWCPEGEL